MSLLWPDTVHVGLFPGASCLKRKRREQALSVRAAPTQDCYAWLRDLDELLKNKTHTPRKGTNVVVTVSDDAASIATLPWQKTLTREDELQAYARVCYETQGMALDGDWTMYAGFRHYGGHGFAYALPTAWLAELIDLLNSHGLCLQRVLPVTAIIYPTLSPRRRDGKSLTLLRETLRSSALIVGKNGMCDYDAEPVIGGDACKADARLLTRMRARHGDIVDAQYCAMDILEGDEVLPEHLADCLPSCTFQTLPKNVWALNLG